MWRGFHAKLTEMKSNPPTEHDAKLVCFLKIVIIFRFNDVIVSLLDDLVPILISRRNFNMKESFCLICISYRQRLRLCIELFCLYILSKYCYEFCIEFELILMTRNVSPLVCFLWQWHNSLVLYRNCISAIHRKFIPIVEFII